MDIITQIAFLALVGLITDQLLAEIEAGGGESLTRAARRIPSSRNNRPATLSRLLRWVLTGVLGPDGKRVKLEAARLAGSWITTPGAIRRFVEAQTPRLTESRPRRHERQPDVSEPMSVRLPNWTRPGSSPSRLLSRCSSTNRPWLG